MIAELVDVRGIGRWTAEMFLIFHLMRPDVSADDLGLQKAVFQHYFAGEKQPRGSWSRPASVGAMALRGDLVSLAQSRSGSGRILTSVAMHLCRGAFRTAQPENHTGV